MTMEKYAFITADKYLCGVSMYTYDDAPKDGIVDYETLRELLDKLSIGTFQIVPFEVGENSYYLVIDDEGKLKHQLVNEVATALSGLYPYDLIVGNALVLANHHDPEMYFMTSEEQVSLMEQIIRLT